VSPVDYGGRSLSPFYSGYQDVFVNDLRLRDRTSALQGNYSSKETNVGMLLRNMNATVLATNDAILSANFMPNKEMYYDTRTYTTGIAEMKYRQTSSSYDFKRGTYTVLSDGDERYSGIYNITRSIHMKSDFPYSELEDDWLPCCFSGMNDMNPLEVRDPGFSPKDVFDCTCYMYPAEGKISKTATGPDPKTFK